MDAQATPFAVLSLIVAPAVLTNACTVLALGTSNRLGRAADSARRLMGELEQEGISNAEKVRANSHELETTQRRMLMLIRALSTFYVAIGGFASAALISLLGAGITALATPPLLARTTELLAIGAGIVAVGALVRGTLLLVRETRLAVNTLEERAERVQRKIADFQQTIAENTRRSE